MNTCNGCGQSESEGCKCINGPTWDGDQMTLKRGDLSPCGTKRFWAYQSFIKKDGNRSESWVPTHQYEAKKAQVSLTNKVSDYLRFQAAELIKGRATA